MKSIQLTFAAVTLSLIVACSSPPTQPIAPPPAAPSPAASQAAAAPVAPLPQSVTTGQGYLYADAPAQGRYPNSWTVLTNTGYESAYDETFRNPAWVAYHLFGTPGPVAPRPSGFSTDTRTTSRVAQSDYPPGYDRGHMAPNNSIATFFGDGAQKETFFMTNMLPQRHGLNAGPWKTVETREYATWMPVYHDVWVIDGPVYTQTDDEPVEPATRYGPKQVCIPVACFKIVMLRDAEGALHTIAFIMPQENASGHKPIEFATSIREIERRTGLDFFSSLPKSEQDRIETAVGTELW